MPPNDIAGLCDRTANRSLLPVTAAAVVVYVAGDIFSALLYDGYSYRDQAISD